MKRMTRWATWPSTLVATAALACTGAKKPAEPELSPRLAPAEPLCPRGSQLARPAAHFDCPAGTSLSIRPFKRVLQLVGGTPVLCAGSLGPRDDTEESRVLQACTSAAREPPEGFVVEERWCARADGTRHGPDRILWENGSVALDQPFVNGQAHGCSTAWYPDGQLHSAREVWHGNAGRELDYSERREGSADAE